MQENNRIEDQTNSTADKALAIYATNSDSIFCILYGPLSSLGVIPEIQSC